MKRKMFLCACMALFLGSTSVMAQNNDRQDGRPDRGEMIEKQANKLAKDFKLDGSKKDNFITLYTQYQNDLMNGRNNGQPRRQQADEEKKELTDAEAKAKVQQMFDREQQQIERQQGQLTVKKSYLPKFSDILTPQQVLKVFAPRGNGQGQRGQGQRGQGMGGNRMGGFGGGMGDDF